jgi:hypothetical protein
MSTMCFVLGLAVVLTGCGGSSSSREPYTFGGPPSPDMPPPMSAGSVVSAPAPRAREARAARIASGNRPLGRLLSGVRHRPAGSSSWDSLESKPIGVELRYALDRPINVDADLPSADTPPDTRTQGHCVYPYAATWIHLRAQEVRTVTVLVDLRRGRVADVWTDAPKGVVSPVPGRPYPDCEQKR